jgi:hypothetical protein
LEFVTFTFVHPSTMDRDLHAVTRIYRTFMVSPLIELELGLIGVVIC